MSVNFRSDGWVKSAQGSAVPGAQIYICTQPANVDTVPPSPLADIFEDPDGLVPLEQPILTDGFGHYDFYVASGIYTVLVALSGTTQQVYPDQSIGSGGGLLLQTNGVDNASQETLNLEEGTGITIEDQEDGTVTISSASGGVTLYDKDGNAPNGAGDTHLVMGQVVLNSGAASVNLIGAAAYSNENHYNVFAWDATDPAQPVAVSKGSGSGFSISGAGAHTIKFMAFGIFFV